MNTFRQKNIIYWINIVFLIVNIAFFVFMFSSHKPSESSPSKGISNDFLKEELKLTEEQYKKLSNMDSLVQKRYQTALRLLCQERYKLMNELAQPEPSVEKLNELAKSIGKMHTALKKQTSYHLLNLKKICTPEQSVKLEKLFRETLEVDSHCKNCPHQCNRTEKQQRVSTFVPYTPSSEDE